MQKVIPAIYRYVRFASIEVRKPDAKVQKQNLMQHNTGVFVKFAAANSIRRIINGRKTELVPFVRQPAVIAGRKENVTPVVNNAAIAGRKENVPSVVNNAAIAGRKENVTPVVNNAAMKTGRKENVTPVVNNATMKMVLKQKG